jgi:adenosylmethionine-8-amino-7-oxononanoate aminotransferase
MLILRGSIGTVTGNLTASYQIYKKALKHGLLLRPLGNVLYFNPPLIINEEEIDQAVSRCFRAIHEVL